jgi:C1A family cysteine protease
MIITGYDNNATAIDTQGRVHKGLLTLRNSWGNKVGDQGDFYMSYDYFKALALEVQRIRSFN